jgi:hypothetical protein
MIPTTWQEAFEELENFCQLQMDIINYRAKHSGMATFDNNKNIALQAERHIYYFIQEKMKELKKQALLNMDEDE